MRRTPKNAYDLLDDMALNAFNWQIQTFYNGLRIENRAMVDATTRGV